MADLIFKNNIVLDGVTQVIDDGEALASNILDNTLLTKEAVEVVVGDAIADKGLITYSAGNGIDITAGAVSVSTKGKGGLAFDPTTHSLYVAVSENNGLSIDSSSGALKMAAANTSSAGAVRLTTTIDNTSPNSGYVPTAGTIHTALGNYVPTADLVTTSTANKVVKLDANGKINSDMLPTLSITNVYTTTTSGGRTSQTSAEIGDVVIETVSGTSKVYILTSGTAATGTWTEITLPSGTINAITVNGSSATITGNTAAITLTFADLWTSDYKETTIGSSSTDNKAPTAKAVYDFVDGGYAKSTHTHTLSNISDAGTAAGKNYGDAAGDVPELTTGGLLQTKVLPLAKSSTIGAVKVPSVNGLSVGNDGAVAIQAAKQTTAAGTDGANLGAAAFSSSHFSVTNGFVSIKANTFAAYSHTHNYATASDISTDFTAKHKVFRITGNNSNTSFYITPGFATAGANVGVEVIEDTTGKTVFCDVTRNSSTGLITITFAKKPAQDKLYTVLLTDYSACTVGNASTTVPA